HHGVQLYGALEIDRSDAAARLTQYKRNYEFFNAPVALFIAIDRRLGPGQWADLGGYIHALMFLARGHGLDTCAQESWARMHRIVGPFVNMPPEQILFCAVSIGYATALIRRTVCARRTPSRRSTAASLDLSKRGVFLGFCRSALRGASATKQSRTAPQTALLRSARNDKPLTRHAFRFRG
ncbi:MAG TPA: nitroreductase family protein, partial [Xanthobacteraceae bacterium]